jgi:ribosomal protein S18 acetylase RimI-like enzyme
VPGDAAALTALRGHLHAAMGNDPQAPGWAQAAEAAFARRLASDPGFAAFAVEDDGALVAGGVGWVVEHLPAPGQLDGRRGHISSMSTHPAHRRRGHARAVATALLGWFRAAGVPRVDLRATPDGLPLYLSLGFREVTGTTLTWVSGR